MTACPVELLGAELDGALPPKEVTYVKEHRLRCSACQQESEMYRALDHDLGLLGEERASPAVSTRVLAALGTQSEAGPVWSSAWRLSPGLRRLVAGAALAGACCAGVFAGLACTSLLSRSQTPPSARRPPTLFVELPPKLQTASELRAYIAQCERKLHPLSRRWQELDAQLERDLGDDRWKYESLSRMVVGVPWEERIVRQQQEDLSILRQWLSATESAGTPPSSSAVHRALERQALPAVRERLAYAQSALARLQASPEAKQTSGQWLRRNLLSSVRRLKRDLQRHSATPTPQSVRDTLRLVERPAAALKRQAEMQRQRLDALTRELQGPNLRQRLTEVRAARAGMDSLQHQAASYRFQIRASRLRLDQLASGPSK